MGAPTLHLAVQYASDRPAPSRSRARRWVESTLAVAAASSTASSPASSAASSPATSAASSSIVGATLTLRFVDADEGRALNRAFRGKDYATNVLTFTLDDAPPDGPARRVQARRAKAREGRGRRVAADIVVCVPVVEREAREQRKDVDAHFAHLVVHGTLHACGHDHEAPAEAAAMEDIERRVLARFRIADPYA